MSRGERLEAERLKKARIKRQIKNTWYDGEKLINNPVHIGILSHSPKSCSCRMCGNPRKYNKGKEKLTRQERELNDKLSRRHK